LPGIVNKASPRNSLHIRLYKEIAWNTSGLEDINLIYPTINSYTPFGLDDIERVGVFDI